ncbi:MAG TPA: AAA family ATPase [Gaiellaceae bacterium]|nr:AAA family ATPase [Gaiellaceae bacterium]
MSATRRERKIVSVVFCDLVGFTARSESLDPEDVEAFLSPYHERVRVELERHGGTVEKFIGDAVMALFGAPVAHEDDPERAVRASLAIREWALEAEDVQVRIAVTTGEALVRLDARPEAGEGMASGDVVNTAARLQSAAPVNGVLVDETTYRATRHVIEYVDATSVEAKGKTEPIPVWEAQRALSRFGVDVAHEARAALVGRDRELAVLRDAFERARHERTPQLVTLVGVPGLGKSRLVFELQRIVDADPELITWRQGRCLAYGDGVTLWALGEIVKAQAGVLEQDSPDEVAAKLSRAAAEVLEGTGDEAWVRSHLLALAGLGEETELGGDRRGEAFAAWRRYLEALADHRPLVLVFEDLHWADESLLDFVDELVDWVSDVPLLVVATARPELLERRPNWGGGKLNATTLALSPLSDEQTAELIGRLLSRPLLAAESQQALLDRAGGNPLYAEQFVDLYLEQGTSDELPLPETLQGIIAARLDALPSIEKTLLQDAAVIGKVFWTEALGREDVASSLHALERKGFVRRQRRSSLEGSAELAFAHALVRDVAYGQIARAERASKHRRVAEWIESLGRPEDHAEMLAYHWSSALELVRASGGEDDLLAERTRRALRDAGDRAFSLNSFAVAASQYEEALELWPEDAERPRLLFQRAHALVNAADERRIATLSEARDALLAVGDRAGSAEAESLLAQVAWYRGEHDEVSAHLRAAEELIEGAAPSVEVARVLAISGRYRSLGGQHGAGLKLAREALTLAERYDLDELRAHALITIGTARDGMGEEEGVRDLEQALEIARASNSPLASTALNNLAVLAAPNDVWREMELMEESRRVAERMGDWDSVRFMDGNLIWCRWSTGNWDEALASASAFIAECEAGSPNYQEEAMRNVRADILLARGHVEESLADGRVAMEQARRANDPQARLPAVGLGALRYVWLGRLDEAQTLADEFVAGVQALEDAPMFVAILTRAAQTLGIAGELRPLAERLRPSLIRDAALAELSGDFVAAGDTMERLGMLPVAAEDRFVAAERLIAAGRQAEGAAQLELALAFFRSVGGTFFVRRGEPLLAGSTQSESA